MNNGAHTAFFASGTRIHELTAYLLGDLLDTLMLRMVLTNSRTSGRHSDNHRPYTLKSTNTVGRHSRDGSICNKDHVNSRCQVLRVSSVVG